MAIKRLSKKFPTLNEGIKSLFKESIVMASAKGKTFFKSEPVEVPEKFKMMIRSFFWSS